MKTNVMYRNIIVRVMVATSLVWSCAKTGLGENPEDSHKVYTAEMVFEGTLTTFDTETRAASSHWEDGSIVYLQFAVGEQYTEGRAIYDAGVSRWNLEFYDAIVSGEELTCHAYYFENPVEITFSDVKLDEHSVVYRDDQGSYYYDGTTLTVNAHLSPISGRIRFEGESGAEYNFSGVTRYTRFDLQNNVLESESKQFEGVLSESGKSTYYYVFFSDDTPRNIYMYDNEGNARFTRKCGDNVLAFGKSGYLSIPSVERHNGWACEAIVKTYTVGDVSFDMVLVTPGTFLMGSSLVGADDDERPVHKVTLTKDYRIGATEVTNDLWAAVMGTTYGEGKENFPKTGISWVECKDFISQLNIMTGGNFAFPTEAEWEFAARGGVMSLGYLYSGSNTIGDVAWYTSNAGGTTHEVKQKKPNELGLYDMSGNVWEWCGDLYASYSKDDVVDPTGPASGSYRVLRGGGYNYNASCCTCTYRDYDTPSSSSSYDGFRLASH